MEKEVNRSHCVRLWELKLNRKKCYTLLPSAVPLPENWWPESRPAIPVIRTLLPYPPAFHSS